MSATSVSETSFTASATSETHEPTLK
jgi:hypothetical protein